MTDAAAGYTQQCTWKHDPTNRVTGHGENLSIESPYSTPGAEMVKGWTDEKANYVPGTTVNAGMAVGAGHYTQMVNKNVKQVGCACAQCGSLSGLDSGFNNSKFCDCKYDYFQMSDDIPVQ